MFLLSMCADLGRILGLGQFPGGGTATHFSVLAWKSHGQRSLTDYSPRDCKELDMTEQLTLSLFSACGSSLYLGQEQCQRGRSRTEPGADCRVAGPPEQSGSFQSAAFILGLGASSVCVHS